MSNETIGLTVDIDGSIAKGKAKVDELAAYAKRMLGSAFSFPANTPGGKPKLLDQFGREIDVAVEKTKKAKSAIQQQFESLIKDIRRAEREAKSIGLADAMTNASRPTAKLIRDFTELSNKMSGLRDKVGGFYDRFSNGSNSSVRALSRLYDNIARVERAMSGVGKRIGEAGSPSLNAASRKLNILDNSDVLGTASAIRSASADAIRPLQEQAAQVKALIRSIQQTSLGEYGSDDILSLRESLDSVKAAGVSAMRSVNSEIKGVDKATDALVASLRVANAELNRLESHGKANAFQKYGMFNNRGISPLFTAQQIVEDYSYAGMRGAANNIAFLLAELAPAGGIGAKLAGGGIIALMTYQFYEMGKSMEWWGNKADDAAEKAKRMKSAIESAGAASNSVSAAMASNQSALIGGGLGVPLGQSGQSYMEMRNRAMMNVMRSPAGIRALRSSISANPANFPFGSVGQNLAAVPQIREAQARAARIQQAINATELMQQNAPSATFFNSTWGGWLANVGLAPAMSAAVPGSGVVLPYVTRSVRSAASGQEASRQEIRSILAGLPGGSQIAAMIDSAQPGETDFPKIIDELKKQYQAAKDEVAGLQEKHKTAMKEMQDSSGAVAAEVLNIAQSNNRAADSVENVIKSNEALNEAYQRQMSLLRNLEILKERDQFRSSAFGLMRSKGAQFMEEAGLPQWMIEQRNMALYERQAGFLFSSSQAAGAAGDTRGQIEYLKQIQQLQFEVIGNTNNRAVAESVMERAIRVQHEIESLIRLNQQQGQAEYEMVQKLTGGLIQMREILNSMPRINLGALQQAGEVAQLNAQLAALRNNTATVQPLTGVAASVAKFGEMPLPGFNRGGHIPGYGGGDKVPALLEKGEFVVNKDAVRALGVDALYDLNSSGVRKFARGGWAGTGYASVHSSYPGSRRRLQRLRAGQSWYRDYRGESASAWARRGVREHREAEYAANQSERAWLAMSGRAPGQISNWGGYGDTGIVASLGEPGSAHSATTYSTNPSSARAVKQWMPSPVKLSGSAPMTGAYPGVHLRRVGGTTFGSFSSDPYSGAGYGQYLGTDGYYRGSHQEFSDLVSYPMRARIRDNGGTVMQAAPDGTFSWNGIGHFSQRDFMAHMRQRNGGMLNVNWGRTVTLPGGREVNTQYGQTGTGGWMDMRMRQRQATANLMSERARQAQAAASASKLRYARQAQAIRNAGANRRAVGNFFASRNGMSPQQVAAMRASRFSGGRWGSNFAAYTGQLFGPGFSPYMGGGFGGWGMPVAPMARSYGLWDSGPAFMGLRAFARGGYVSSQGGRLIASGPDIFQGDTEFEYMGGYPAMGPDFNYMNYQSFMDQRRRVLAGSLNAAYGGPTDMAGNTLGSFGTFSDGSLRSRYSGGFSTVNQHQGFGSSMRGMGFSSFRRPIGAMTGGYITTAGNVARFANGGYVGKSSGTSISNNFGSIRIEVKSPKDAVDTSYQLRRTRSSYWAQKG